MSWRSGTHNSQDPSDDDPDFNVIGNTISARSILSTINGRSNSVSSHLASGGGSPGSSLPRCPAVSSAVRCLTLQRWLL